jgi:hypothetical protein
MLPLSQQTTEPPAPRTPGLAVVGPRDVAPPPPDPPSQPWLRGAAAVALLPILLDPSLPARRARAPYLFRHPRHQRLQQLLVLKGALFPFAMAPVEMRRRFFPKKLPVIGRHGTVAPSSRRALDQISDRDLTKTEMRTLFAKNPRPQTRAECQGGIRPCPWVSCRHHLLLDVNPNSGAIRLNHPGVTLEEMPHTCALDLADEGPLSLSQIGARLGISHERVRQIEVEAQASYAAARAEIEFAVGPRTR